MSEQDDVEQDDVEQDDVEQDDVEQDDVEQDDQREHDDVEQDDQREHDELTAHLARVLSFDGQGEVLDVEAEVFEEMRELFRQGVTDDLRAHYAAVGEFISRAASAEQQVEVLAAFLLNPMEPGRAASALKPLTAAKARELTAALLLPRWPDMRRLISELGHIAAMRNRFAHHPLTPFQISADGKSISREVTIAYRKWTKDLVEEVREPAPKELILDWAHRARLASSLISKSMYPLLVWERAGLMAPPDFKIDILVYGIPGGEESEESSGFDAEDRALFERIYNGR